MRYNCSLLWGIQVYTRICSSIQIKSNRLYRSQIWMISANIPMFSISPFFAAIPFDLHGFFSLLLYKDFVFTPIVNSIHVCFKLLFMAKKPYPVVSNTLTHLHTYKIYNNLFKYQIFCMHCIHSHKHWWWSCCIVSIFHLNKIELEMNAFWCLSTKIRRAANSIGLLLQTLIQHFNAFGFVEQWIVTFKTLAGSLVSCANRQIGTMAHSHVTTHCWLFYTCDIPDRQ